MKKGLEPCREGRVLITVWVVSVRLSLSCALRRKEDWCYYSNAKHTSKGYGISQCDGTAGSCLSTYRWGSQAAQPVTWSTIVPRLIPTTRTVRAIPSSDDQFMRKLSSENSRFDHERLVLAEEIDPWNFPHALRKVSLKGARLCCVPRTE